MLRLQSNLAKGAAIALCAVLWLPALCRADDQSATDFRPANQRADELLQLAGVEGGLVVHLGCGDGHFTAALRSGDAYLVHGLDRDADRVRQARAHVAKLGIYGTVSIAHWDGLRLPYADNLVTLLVVDKPGEVSREEVQRVLAPGGVVCVRTADGWKKTTKPWPPTIDQWTHYLYGPDNNAVSDDVAVGPPQHFQWISRPRFSRSHDHLASVSTVVSAKGRLFYIVDEGPIALAAANPRWRLVARDAFNGVRLWEREITPWEYHLRDFRSGPADLARRLVAVDDRVYVTLGYGKPVTALDAATGKTVREYAGTGGTREIICEGNRLFLVIGETDTDWPASEAKRIVSQEYYFPPFERYTPPARNTHVAAVDAETGAILWTHAKGNAAEVMPSTLASSGGRVYFQSADAVVCLDAGTGDTIWKAPRPVHRHRLAWSTPTLVVYEDVVFSADRRAANTEGELLWIPSGGYHQYIRGDDAEGELVAYDAATGKRLWSCPAYEGFNAPVDVLIADGLVWTGRYTWGGDPGITNGRDPRTGEVRRQRPRDQEFLPPIGHARCHRAKATCRYLILGRRGVEFIDVETGRMIANRWVRGICQYGVLPANGLLYVPPHSCACQVDDLLKSGFMALAPQAAADDASYNAPAAQDKSHRVVRGPAYAEAVTLPPQPENPSDWPTYRHDAQRSGTTSAPVANELDTLWQAELGGELTSPVVAEGVLLVADSCAHRVFALDAASGRKSWSFTADARIDSPPTIHRSRALFGSAGGWVYCLRLSDGELVWKFHPAPHQRLIVVDGQLESAWPVSGSVLALDGAVYFVAGRSGYLDGGLRLCKLDAATGEAIRLETLHADEESRNSGLATLGCLPDVLSAKGDSIFMRNARFDQEWTRQKGSVPHIWSSVGFLDDSWWHRTYWQYGSSMDSGWSGWPKAARQAPAGRLLVTDGSVVWGFGRTQYDIPGAHVGIDAQGVWGPIAKDHSRWTYYRLFAKTLDTGSEASPGASGGSTRARSGWTRGSPVLVQGMLLAGDRLFVAGPVDPLQETPHAAEPVDRLAQALENTQGGRLLTLSAADGKTLSECELTSPPVFDGMAAADGRLYLSTKSGTVVCLGSQGEQ